MADLLPEKWMKAMAVTTTVLGVVASIGISRASFYINKSQLLTAQEADQWSYYDAKSIKQDLYRSKIKSLQFKQLGATTPSQQGFLSQAIANYSQEIDRYEKEKTGIKQHAQSIDQQNKLFGNRGSQFSLSVVFAQIAIMLSSVGLLLKHREMWIIGLVFGAISLFFIANGFLLFLQF